MMSFFCGSVDRRKASILISSQDHCQRFSPSQISNTPRCKHQRKQTSEEAKNVIIPFQLNYANKSEINNMKFKLSITVFYLLLQFYYTQEWKTELQMWSIYWCIDIEKRSKIHSNLLDQDILNLYALSGCNTIPVIYGIEKIHILLVIKSNLCFPCILLMNDLSLKKNR